MIKSVTVKILLTSYRTMERQTLLIGVSIFVLATAAGFLGTQQGSDQPEKFRSLVNVTVDSDQNTREINFDNRSLNLMYEDHGEARMYIDLDQDGSFDLELENLTHNGEVRETTQIVTLKAKSYRLYFRYKDDANEPDDAFLKLYQIREL